MVVPPQMLLLYCLGNISGDTATQTIGVCVEPLGYVILKSWLESDASHLWLIVSNLAVVFTKVRGLLPITTWNFPSYK